MKHYARLRGSESSTVAFTVSKRRKMEKKRQDPLRRFVPTPFATDLPVMGRTIRLETDSELILDQIAKFLERHVRKSRGTPEFLWRIVTEAGAGMIPSWPEISAFSEDGLRLNSIGQQSFLGIDLESREAVGILTEALAADEAGLRSPFLDNLFCMTASTLRLVPLSAACVALGEKGLLVFGPPNSGKTTSGYLSTRLGLEFHADQVVFLEIEGAELRAWGDFLPAVFRPEALQLLPELRAATHPFHYRDLTFFYLEKKRFQSSEAHPVIPLCSVFLERRQPCGACLAPLSGLELHHRLTENQLFKDDQRFEAQRTAVFRALGELPAYRLAYGADPAEAVDFYRNILVSHNSREVKR